MNDKRWKQAERILCIRLDYLGDVLMSTPAIRALKQARPDRHITLLTSGSGAAAARFIPEIDDTIVYAAPWMKSSEPCTAQADLAMIERLASGRFDAAVIFTVYSQNPLPAALLCHLAGIPLRLAHCHENPYQLLTHWVQDPEPQNTIRHEVQRQLDLVGSVGAHTENLRLSFQVLAQDRKRMRERLRALDIDISRPWVVLHPGATAASRRYPAKHWHAVARHLSDQLGCPLILTGSGDEEDLVESIRQGLTDTHSLAGQLTLGELAAIIEQAPLLISNNTGPAHMAAALGTPVVDLYALTNPQHTPWHVPHRVLFHDVPCGFCYKSTCPLGHHHCLAKVDPLQVVRAAVDLLAAPLHSRPSDIVRLTSSPVSMTRS